MLSWKERFIAKLGRSMLRPYKKTLAFMLRLCFEA
jgi:hypothetical protein